MADRDYKVTYKSRVRPIDDYDNYDSRNNRRYEQDRDRPRSRYYEDDYRRGADRDRERVSRTTVRREDDVIFDRRDDGYDRVLRRDDRERDLALVPSRPRQTTRTEYDFLSDREDVFSRSTGSGNVIVLDSRDRDRGDGGGLTEWEIVRPERTADGAIIIDADDFRRGGGGGRRYEYDDRDKYRGTNGGLEVVVASAGRVSRDRSVGRRSLVDAMREVRVTEDVEDDRRSVYSRGGGDRRSRIEVVPAAAPEAPRRFPTALRHDHSPSSDTRRRSRSIGFHRSQISHHDASERKHERPGAEAANCGRYLIDHRGERIEDDERSYAGSRVDRDRSRRRRHRSRGGEEHDYERSEKRERYYEEERNINPGFVERTRPYSPQRAPSPDPEQDREERRKHRRHRRHRRSRRDERDVEVEEDEEEDDRKSYYSEHYRKTKRVYED